MRDHHSTKKVPTKQSMSFPQEQSQELFHNKHYKKKIHQQQHNTIIKKIIIASLIFLTFLMIFEGYFQQDYEAQPIEIEGKLIKEIQSKAEEDQITFQELNPKEMIQILKQMMKRPKKKLSKSTHIFKPTEQAYFAYSLYLQPDNPKFMQAEYYYYESKYNISQYSELPLCIVAPGRNLQTQGRYLRFFQSIAKQNYTNYKLIYIDDHSSDETVASIRRFLLFPSMEKLLNKTKILANKQRVYALANRNSGIRNYCDEDDIILDIDPDDIILGRQAFKFINSVYQNPDVWIFYTNYVLWSSRYDEPSQGISGQISEKILRDNVYRTSDMWLTSATRTFRRKIFMKIDDDDFKDGKGKFYKWSSDLYMHYSLVQLAGPQHYKYLDQIFYYYYSTRNRHQASEKTLDKWNSYTLTPYQPLKSLEDEGKKVQNYKIPHWIERKKKQLEDDIRTSKVNQKPSVQEEIDKMYFRSDLHPRP